MIDEWNGLAVLLTDLIEKYAADLDIDSLPDPIFIERESDTDKKVHKKNIEVEMAA